MPLELSPEVKGKIVELLARYPERQAALLPVLHLVQHELGYLSIDAQAAVAKELAIPATAVHEVTTFYEMYHQHPEGQFHLEVCTNISCHLAGADALVAHLKKALKVEVGHQTENGEFSLIEAECLASCGTGPMLRCGNDYYEYLTIPAVDALLGRLRAEAPGLDGKHYDQGKNGPHVGPVPGFEPPMPEALAVGAPAPAAPPPLPSSPPGPPGAPSVEATQPAQQTGDTAKGPEPSSMPKPGDEPLLRPDAIAAGDSSKNLPAFDPPPLKRRSSGPSINEPPHTVSEQGASEGASDASKAPGAKSETKSDREGGA